MRDNFLLLNTSLHNCCFFDANSRYGRVEKKYGVLGSVRIIHEYERPQLKVSGGENVSRKRATTGMTRLKIHRTTTHQNYKEQSQNLTSSKTQPDDSGENSQTLKQVSIRGKKAEFQNRCKPQITLAPADRDPSRTNLSSEFLEQIDSNRNSSPCVRKISRDENRAASAPSTLLLPPVFKLSTSRIVGRRALSAPPFNRSCALEGASTITGSVIHVSNCRRRETKYIAHENGQETAQQRPRSAISIGKRFK